MRMKSVQRVSDILSQEGIFGGANGLSMMGIRGRWISGVNPSDGCGGIGLIFLAEHYWLIFSGLFEGQVGLCFVVDIDR